MRGVYLKNKSREFLATPTFLLESVAEFPRILKRAPRTERPPNSRRIRPSFMAEAGGEEECPCGTGTLTAPAAAKCLCSRPSTPPAAETKLEGLARTPSRTLLFAERGRRRERVFPRWGKTSGDEGSLGNFATFLLQNPRIGRREFL